METHKGKKSDGYSVASVSKRLGEEHLKKAKSADIISMYSGPNPWEFIFNGNYQKKLQNQTDAEYWKIFNYKFLREDHILKRRLQMAPIWLSSQNR